MRHYTPQCLAARHAGRPGYQASHLVRGAVTIIPYLFRASSSISMFVQSKNVAFICRSTSRCNIAALPAFRGVAIVN